MRLHARPTSLLAASAALLVSGGLAGCSDSPGPVTGYHAFTTAAAQDMPDLCDAFFGTEDELGERLGTTLYHEDRQEPGVCLYGSEGAGDSVAPQVTDEKPDGAALVAKGDEYFVGLFLLEDGEQGSVDRELREDLVEWLGDRAGSVEDDLAEWTAALPATEPGLGANDGYAPAPEDEDAEPEPVDGGTAKAGDMLLTPYGTVSVAPWPERTHLWFDGEPMRPADGEMFVAASVFVESGEDATGDEFTLRVDGVDVSEPVRDALDEVVLGQTTQLLVSVPADAASVEIAVGPPGDDAALQSISLLDGEISDGGRSERLAEAVSGSTEADETRPQMLDGEGQDSFWVGVPTPFRSWDVGWALVPWTSAGGWSPEDSTALVVYLNAYEPEKAAQLSTADASAVVDGVEVQATSYDPETYSFTFMVPEGADRAQVQTRYTVQSSTPGFTATGPIVHDISIDLHSGSSIYE